MVLEIALGIVLGVGFLIAIALVLWLLFGILVAFYDAERLRYLFLGIGGILYLIVAIGFLAFGGEEDIDWIGAWMILIPLVWLINYKIHQAKTKSTNSQTSSKSIPPTKVVKVECKECGHKGEPKAWWTRRIYGIIISMIALMPGIVYFVFTNPYICRKCGSRRNLAKILHNGQKVDVKSMGRWLFSIISVLVILSPLIGIFAIMFTLPYFEPDVVKTPVNNSTATEQEMATEKTITKAQLFEAARQKGIMPSEAWRRLSAKGYTLIDESVAPSEPKAINKTASSPTVLATNNLTPEEKKMRIEELEMKLKEIDRKLESECKLKLTALKSELYKQDISDVLEVFFSTKTKSCLFVFQELTYRDVPEFHRVSTSRKKQLIDFETRKVLEEHEDIGFNEDFFNDFNRKVDGYR